MENILQQFIHGFSNLLPISYIFERKHIKTKSGLVPYKKYTTTQWLIKISAIKGNCVWY